jgi:hypothetical protein
MIMTSGQLVGYGSYASEDAHYRPFISGIF